MKNASLSAPGTFHLDDTTFGLETLVTYQLRQLTYLNSRSATREYERKFGLTLNEWRMLALLYQEQNLSLNGLAEQGQFDRGLTSRVVAALVERGYISRQINSHDARGVVLSLTPTGIKFAMQVFQVAQERNRKLLSCLTKAEVKVLKTALVKLKFQAGVMYELEHEESGNTAKLQAPGGRNRGIKAKAKVPR